MLVLIATWRERSLHRPNKHFIACLAVADLLVGLFLAPLKLYQLPINQDLSYKLQYKMPIHLCRFVVWIDTFGLTTSIYTLTFISFDRYLKISKPLKYMYLMTNSRAKKIVFAIVLISTAFATYSATPLSKSAGILATGSVGPCFTMDSKYFYLVLIVSMFLLPTLVISIMYALIFRVAHKRQKMLRNGDMGQTNINLQQRTASSTLRQDMKVIRMLVIIMGVFLLCWSPWFISVTNWVFADHSNSSEWIENPSRWYEVNIILQAVNTPPLFNSLCNPIIYAWLDQTYREAFKHLFHQTISWFGSRFGRKN
ncbi:octopamine receptor beta-2R-like [Dendronephthya gigantea]|uniref:octopamine receptor beta-2R-like n=1 Tax=Dendronephthya gigantea TaxID=151771 RepID=UPI00106C1B2C|nr:octopamine receptor beta-2R-like [Dendronephthya gigantea]